MQIQSICDFSPELTDLLYTQLEKLELACFSAPWSEQALRDEAQNPDACLLCAVQDGTLLGYGSMRVVCGEGYMNNLAVSRDCRGRGIGSALLEALLQCARQRHAAFLSLEVRASNTGAIRLYEKAGFKQVGKRKNFYRAPQEDALIMTADLPPCAQTGRSENKREGKTSENSGY